MKNIYLLVLSLFCFSCTLEMEEYSKHRISLKMRMIVKRHWHPFTKSCKVPMADGLMGIN